MNLFNVKPIGIIRSEHKIAGNTPIQPVYAEECTGSVEIFSEYAEGLQDIEGFSHIILLCWLHMAKSGPLLVKPFLQDVTHGVFATRAPGRPNPVGISIVRLVSRDGSVLNIQGVDILDETPVLDIKPYSSIFDCYSDARNGWQEAVDGEEAAKKGKRGYQKSIAGKENF
ncbi:MAG: tRNA (N6-threonylcarbamoyladenosine(37)-N6)-methyltransferase TrmO [Chitinispirillaceae bacterium]|nr:tRNA (N6-threonylcarbamoyladenosine(37)-N6)-methyltransferase TrmO [Chitinispirillaceae bacterium]